VVVFVVIDSFSVVVVVETVEEFVVTDSVFVFVCACVGIGREGTCRRR